MVISDAIQARVRDRNCLINHIMCFITAAFKIWVVMGVFDMDIRRYITNKCQDIRYKSGILTGKFKGVRFNASERQE
jgi:hypothetical protein